MTELPPWYPWPDTETKPSSMPLLLVQAFLNTWDAEKGVDLLADAEWFVRAGLMDGDAGTSRDELELARTLRESIRDLVESGDADLSPLRKVAASGAPQLTVADGGRLGLAAPSGGLKDALFQLLLVIRGAQEDGTWSRLRVCANDECRWAFYDRSKNKQGHWCDMAVCGNRLKNREFRARRAGAAAPSPDAPRA